jgi:tRNA modification GTPase
MIARDTIFALSSGRAPAAISVIRISGPKAHAAGAVITGALPEPRFAAVRELRHPRSGELLDEALVLRFDAPASSTGEDIVEFQCHGGRAVVDALLAALGDIDGLRPADPGEFTRRAFENGRIDLTEAEGLADLIEAETDSQRKAALALAEGGLRKQIALWQERLLGLSAQAERAIDYDADDDDEAIDPALLRDCAALGHDLRAWLDQPRIEPLKDGVRVVVAGPPNIGKSSLVNVIAGEDRVIVTDVPGTTRDHIDVTLSLGGVPLRLTDTAGIRATDDRVEAIGVERAEWLIETADVLVWLGESAEAPQHPQMVLIHAKCDLPARKASAGTLPVSSITGEGLSQLLARVEELARKVLPAEDAVALNRRQAGHLAQAADALGGSAGAADVVLVAEGLRLARVAFDRLTGRSGVEEVLDALFGRFCLGK